MNPLSVEVGQALGRRVSSMKATPGGDINQAFEVHLEDGAKVFVKHHPTAPAGMFAAEAKGLAFLAEAGALRIPAVLAVTEAFLALEWIDSAEAAAAHDEALGQGLAALHRAGTASFGLPYDNFIGRLPQANQPLDTWAEFYQKRRLFPQIRLAVDHHRVPESIARSLDQLLERVVERVGPPEPPARLHGDLWGGNAMTDEHGAPCLIDPAVYGGHREVDLSMMKLFGGFRPRVFAAYQACYPLLPGHEDRLPLYQLYYLLVHVNLFGGAYVDSVRGAVARLL